MTSPIDCLRFHSRSFYHLNIIVQLKIKIIAAGSNALGTLATSAGDGYYVLAGCLAPGLGLVS